MYSAYESLSSMYENSYNRYIRALFAEMRRLGLVEGKSITIERYGRETPDVTSKNTIAAIVDSKPDIIFCVGAAAVFQQATRTIPIVALTIDAVREGLVKSLSHPGGNLTGVTFEPELPIHGKRFALLREIFPTLKSPAFLANSGILTYYWPAAREAADAQGMALVACPVSLPSSEAIYREAITKAKDEGADAIMVALDVDAVVRNALVVNLIEAAGLPAIYPFTDFVVAGGLMSYSTDLVELNKRMASDIHAILNGTKPGDIPVYQPTKFEFYINLKTAKALSLNVPATLLSVADMVIE
ncbi:ABC transporter substrate-binding protein [Bradyrhizobium sp. CCBAU 51745]|uniref:ABC transporter substrate-binding protein n=1 Tax=Bradyrhizobium sp. CCBAU 51745 TaxID=1325099 RepID=UPI0023067462|nr:ABC transporter substrate-binding protein [Bradyrhizobium sp. CCBAU 51745]